jgi:hypothetical protein
MAKAAGSTWIALADDELMWAFSLAGGGKLKAFREFVQPIGGRA